jgi:exodeoxyribonuclease VII small subunit
MPTKQPTPNLENSLTELEQLVTKMEKGQLTLEDSMSEFEKGIHLIKQCQTTLKNAEQKVKNLSKDNNEEN